jgi:hypothetical protein
MVMTTMGTRLTLQRADRIKPSDRVCHYDELGERAKERLPELVDCDDGTVTIDREAYEGFNGCDLVKFTHYYRLIT